MKYKLLILLIFSLNVFANSCPKTEVKVFDNVKWTKHDDEVLKRAKTRCPSIYKDLPCLKKFEKVKNNTYHAICGK